MERESFSDPAIAREMNDDFVCIKVDREERPDVDEIYMTATQLIDAPGGWPNSVFLTPDLKPFFAGTYFPPRDVSGRPGFPRVLQSLRQTWLFRRAEVLQQAEMRGARRCSRRSPPRRGRVDSLPERRPRRASCSRRSPRASTPSGAASATAPKFPSPANLFFLLERSAATRRRARCS